MKITVYTIKDCAFSKQEREYLNGHSLAYEEKDLETNKDFLTEMLAISNNFAGTPVTRVEKDDGSIVVLKGFTREEFDTTFGFAIAPTDNKSPVTANETPLTTEVPPKIEEVKPAAEVVPPVETTPPAPVPTDIPPVETPVTTTPDPLKSVMDDLQSKSQPAIPPAVESVPSTVETPPVAEQPAANPPVNSPTIPDFPAK